MMYNITKIYRIWTIRCQRLTNMFQIVPNQLHVVHFNVFILKWITESSYKKTLVMAFVTIKLLNRLYCINILYNLYCGYTVSHTPIRTTAPVKCSTDSSKKEEPLYHSRTGIQNICYSSHCKL